MLLCISRLCQYFFLSYSLPRAPPLPLSLLFHTFPQMNTCPITPSAQHCFSHACAHTHIHTHTHTHTFSHLHTHTHRDTFMLPNTHRDTFMLTNIQTHRYI